MNHAILHEWELHCPWALARSAPPFIPIAILQGRDEGVAAPGPASERAELESQVEMLVAALADARAEAVSARSAAQDAAAELAAALRTVKELRSERCSLRELQAATAEAAAQAAALEREKRGLQATLGVERVERRELELAQAEIEGLRVCLGESQAAWAAHVAAQELRGREAGPEEEEGVQGAPGAAELERVQAELAQTRAELGQTRAELTGAQADLAHAHAELPGRRRELLAAEQPLDLQNLKAVPHPSVQPDAGLPAASAPRVRPDSADSASPGPASRDLEELRDLLSGAGSLASDPGAGPVQRSVSVPVGKGELRGDDRHEPYLEELALCLPCNGACATAAAFADLHQLSIPTHEHNFPHRSLGPAPLTLQGAMALAGSLRPSWIAWPPPSGPPRGRSQGCLRTWHKHALTRSA